MSCIVRFGFRLYLGARRDGRFQTYQPWTLKIILLGFCRGVCKSEMFNFWGLMTSGSWERHCFPNAMAMFSVISNNLDGNILQTVMQCAAQDARTGELK